MAKPFADNPDFMQLEDWTDTQLLTHEPMTEMEELVWNAIVTTNKQGRTDDMLQLVAIFDAIQHGDLDAVGGLPAHSRAFRHILNEAMFGRNAAELLSHFGLAL